jgi:hypothetical protein
MTGTGTSEGRAVVNMVVNLLVPLNILQLLSNFWDNAVCLAAGYGLDDRGTLIESR